MDARSFRQVMGRFPTGVTVVTARAGNGDPVGLTVNSFTSVSLDPPLVLVCIDRASSSHDRLLAADAFAVNILSSSQEPVARRFSSEPSAERFRGIAWSAGPQGAPALAGAVARLSCSIERTLEAGDHTILLGRVHAAEAGEGEALAFLGGRYGKVSAT